MGHHQALQYINNGSSREYKGEAEWVFEEIMSQIILNLMEKKFIHTSKLSEFQIGYSQRHQHQDTL